MMYDVIVIGGGPSGLMASYAAAIHGAKVLLVDKGDKLGRKLGISGGGRCNVTNNKPVEDIIKHIPGNGKFLYSAFDTFNNQHIISFFEEMGIHLKEEDRGRMFPVTDKAKTVVHALIQRVRTAGVTIKINSPVENVSYENNQTQGIYLKNNELIRSTCVIIAVGGKSVPHTGSEGDGYGWAEEAGHTITELYPTEVPLTSAEPFIQSKQLQGLSLRHITLSVWNPKGKKVISHEGDMIFTHFGISGPAVLRCSQFVVKMRKKFSTKTVLLTMDLFPDQSLSDVQTEMERYAKAESKKAIKNVLKQVLPDRLIPLLLEKVDLAGELTFFDMPKQKWMQLTQLIKNFPIMVNGTLSIEEAFVTGGGIHLKEVDPKTMQSKLMPGLFFCGEVLDIHGYTGGFNITAAFSTGYNAGKSAAEHIILLEM